MSTPTPGLAVHRVTAAAMAERAVALLGERLAAGASPDDLAVLARVNSALLPVQVALTDAGIAHTAPLDATVLGRTGVRTALAYLRLGLDTERIRRDDVFDTINRPARKVKSAVQPLLPKGNRFSMRQLEQVADSLGETHRDRFRGYLGDLRGLEAAITDQADTAKCLWIIRNRIGLGEAMDALDASRSRPEGSSHGDDLDALEQLAALQPDPASFRDWLLEHLRVPGDPSGITLSSVHRVKGMEWPHVVVFAANQGLFPHRLADDVEEERRVFHVAITRCQEHVDVIADQARTAPFVEELTTAAEPVTATPGGAATAGTSASAARRPTAAAAAADATPSPVTPTRTADGAVHAIRGLQVTVVGGLTGAITEVARDHAVVTVSAGGGPADRDGDAPGVAHGGVAADGHCGVAADAHGDAPVDAHGDAAADGAGDAGRVHLRVPFGQRVTIDGVASSLVRPPTRRGARVGGSMAGRTGSGGGGGPSDRLVEVDEDAPIDDALFEALRSWRARIAAENGLPAYLIFHDRHLQLIAGRKPADLRELAGCPGVGPTKLERYGDDVLDVVAAHTG